LVNGEDFAKSGSSFMATPGSIRPDLAKRTRADAPMRCYYWFPNFARMSIDHVVYSSPVLGSPTFLDVAPGMTVIVKHDFLTGEG